jgi:hypothetical protein
LHRHDESRVLRELGRLPESWTRFAAALEVGKSERLGGFTIFNQVEHLGTGAIAASAEGRSAEANRLLQRAAAASAAFTADNADPGFRSIAEDRVTVARLTVASLEGRWSGVETELNSFADVLLRAVPREARRRAESTNCWLEVRVSPERLPPSAAPMALPNAMPEMNCRSTSDRPIRP